MLIDAVKRIEEMPPSIREAIWLKKKLMWSVRKEIKQTQETLDTTPAERTEIIEECKFRIAVYDEFVPKMMEADAIEAVIKETLAELGIDAPTVKDKGKIMKVLMPKVKGKADGKLVNQLLSGMFV